MKAPNVRAPSVRAPTGGVKRRWFRWLGLFLLLLYLEFLVGSGGDALAHELAFVRFALGALSGLLFVLSTVDLPWRIEWYRLAGLGYLCFAASYLLTNLAAEDELWWLAVSLATAALFGFMGFDIARGGRHFDIDDADA
ncbi:hypothetical protein [Haladaptatus salinisoli]|uniref:hypothetical protein n=1 Tax=Haladaptatus salinisoli TaxID=2884876 RepID=UPI001D0A64F4|nr:hypothetical protein [Haladaptatus salinisoli]